LLRRLSACQQTIEAFKSIDLARQTLSEPELRTLTNTKMLFDHLVGGPDAIPGLQNRSDWFEPAFPAIPEPHLQEAPRAGKGIFLLREAKQPT
jgi:hypothetical protein